MRPIRHGFKQGLAGLTISRAACAPQRMTNMWRDTSAARSCFAHERASSFDRSTTRALTDQIAHNENGLAKCLGRTALVN